MSMMPNFKMRDFYRPAKVYIPRVEHGTDAPRWSLDPAWLAQKKSAKLWRQVNKLLRANAMYAFYSFPDTGHGWRIKAKRISP